jgi:hypothetical protein
MRSYRRANASPLAKTKASGEACPSFPRSAWERTAATLRVASPRGGESRAAERPGVRSHAERGNEENFSCRNGVGRELLVGDYSLRVGSRVIAKP